LMALGWVVDDVSNSIELAHVTAILGYGSN
jgi:hypothetical protein